MKTYLISCLFPLLFLSFFASAQKATQPPAAFIEIGTDNDFYYLRLPSDRYYTTGQWLEWQTHYLDSGPWSPGRIFPLRFPSQNALNTTALRINHQLFTPFNIRWDQAEQIDRPYATTLDFNLINTTYLSDLSIKKTLQFGLVGPSLHGEALQNWLHRLKGRPLAQGWDYQLANRSYWAAEVQAEKNTFHETEHQLFLLVPRLKIGNQQQYVQLGGHYKAGAIQDYFRPIAKPLKQLQWSVYFHLDLRYVHKNALLDGSLQPGVSTDAYQTPDTLALLILAKYGIQLNYYNWQLELSQSAISPEFSGGSSHYWGGIALRWYY